MAGQLLVRTYNVGFGDCIYLRVPDLEDEIHILIDCGNKFGDLDVLGRCIAHLKQELPEEESGKKRVDLLVVSHPHEDHHKGFEADFFADLHIKNIWLSPAYNYQDERSAGFRSLQALAVRSLSDLSLMAAGDLKAQVDDLLLSLTKQEAFDMLCRTLPQANGIQPLFVSADTPEDQLAIFQDGGTRLKILGPMGDIDAYYLGGEGLLNPDTVSHLAEGYEPLLAARETQAPLQPVNISELDFQMLRERVRVNALALVELAGRIANNLSVVLLLEWKDRRLLFTGDAEWDAAYKGKVKAGRKNGSWNVMWKERRDDLSKPLDFLKVGHHGSENATPWTPPDPKTNKEHPINQILNHLLPLPEAGQAPKALAVVSTQRTAAWPSIPSKELLVELGRRVANIRTDYVEDDLFQPEPANAPQPQRTDLEALQGLEPGQAVAKIDIFFDE